MYEELPEWMFWGAIGWTLAMACRDLADLERRTDELKKQIEKVDRDLQQLKRDLDAYEHRYEKKGIWRWLLW